jgi:hypothetical protein
MRLVIALIVWAAAIAGAAGLSSVVAQHVHTEQASASVDASKVTATNSLSMFRTANFAKALAIAQNKLGADAQLDQLVVYPGYADFTAVKGGTEVDLYVNVTGTADVTTGGTPGDEPLFPLSKFKASDPEALAARIAKAGHVPQAGLNYMVAQADPITRHFDWLIYPQKGHGVDYFQTSGPARRLFVYKTNSQTGLTRVRGT